MFIEFEDDKNVDDVDVDIAVGCSKIGRSSYDADLLEEEPVEGLEDTVERDGIFKKYEKMLNGICNLSAPL